MKKFFLLILILISLLSSIPAYASPYRQSSDDVYVKGYTKSNGTYVEPHYRSHPDGDRSNNYGS